MPQTVSHARALLYLQAVIWGLLCFVATVNATSSNPVLDPAFLLGTAGVAGGLAVAKARLGHRISRGGDGTRRAVVAVESLMACLGALGTLAAVAPGGGVPALAFLVGGGMSLKVATGLTRPPARQYFAAPGTEITQASPASEPGDGHGEPFWRLAPGVAG